MYCKNHIAVIGVRESLFEWHILSASFQSLIFPSFGGLGYSYTQIVLIKSFSTEKHFGGGTLLKCLNARVLRHTLI